MVHGIINGGLVPRQQTMVTGAEQKQKPPPPKDTGPIWCPNHAARKHLRQQQSLAAGMQAETDPDRWSMCVWCSGEWCNCSGGYPIGCSGGGWRVRDGMERQVRYDGHSTQPHALLAGGRRPVVTDP